MTASGAPPAPRTIEALQAELSRRQACREAEMPGVDVVLNGAFVFREHGDGSVEMFVHERGELVHGRRFAGEVDAVASAWAQVYGLEAAPTRPRRPDHAQPRTVEQLKDALAQVGQEPDQVTRAELLRESPKTDPLLVLESCSDGRVATYQLERGVDGDRVVYPDEAAAVADLAARRLTPHVGDEVDDLRMERMGVHARQYRHRWEAHLAGTVGSGS